MNWILIIVALALFVTWAVLHFVFGYTLGLLNMFWMLGFLFLVLSGVQSLEG